VRGNLADDGIRLVAHWLVLASEANIDGSLSKPSAIRSRTQKPKINDDENRRQSVGGVSSVHDTEQVCLHSEVRDVSLDDVFSL
jgi:hypothetical protein